MICEKHLDEGEAWTSSALHHFALVQRLVLGSGPAAEVEATTVCFSLNRIVVAAANVVLVEVESISITTFL